MTAPIGQFGSGPGIEQAGDLETRVTRLETWINFLQNFEAYPVIPTVVTVQSQSELRFGAVSVPLGVLRPVLQMPEDRWDVWAAGLIQGANAPVTMGIVYIDNTGAVHTLGSGTYPANAGTQKVVGGPLQVRGRFAAAAGIPQNEPVLTFGITARMAGPGQSAYIDAWTLFVRQSPRRS